MTTQLDCSLTLAKEATYGVAVTTERAYEFVSESLDWAPKFVQGVGLRVGSRVARAARRKLAQSSVGGDVAVECVTKGMGVLWEACLGVATSTALADGVSFQQLFTPTLSDYLPSYTIQKGIPPVGGGATLPHTFTGCQVSRFELSVSTGGILELKVTWAGKDVDTSTAYAAPGYATDPELFTFVDGSITVGGTLTMPTTTTLASGGTEVATITNFDLTVDNKLDSGGFTLGGAGMRTRPAAVGLAAITGKVTAEFDDTTLRDAYLNQNNLAMVLTFEAETEISAGVFPTLQVVIPLARLEGELPKSNGGDVITQSVDFTVLDDSTNPPLSIIAVTSDTAL